ncbi:hypothetical protein P7K49_040219 [Saguinus oedipus]|uniref:Uncharacterized protein n=1 Tax=Saguinus oedipus TaxID=9490 RepID=A0ABQ9T8M8_SAGOE|nr:hypothetical protein P7K49_040219 [Saguinus oedipus]
MGMPVMGGCEGERRGLSGAGVASWACARTPPKLSAGRRKVSCPSPQPCAGRAHPWEACGAWMGKILNETQDGAFCYWEICGPNGMVEKHFNICVSTTPRPSTLTTFTTVTLPTTPTTFTTTSTTQTPSTGEAPWCPCASSDFHLPLHPASSTEGSFGGRPWPGAARLCPVHSSRRVR